MSVKMLIDLEVGRSEGLDWWILTWWSLTSAEKEDISGNLWCIPQVLNSHFFTANFILLHLVFITHVEYTLFKQILKISFCPKKEKRMGEICYLSSVQFSCSVIFNSLWPPGLQHARLPCQSSTPSAYSNSCPASWWCHPTISSSGIPFSSHLQSFPASGSFQVSLFLASGGRSIGVSASASVLLMNIQDWFPLGWTGLIYLQSKGLSRIFSNTTIQKHQFFGTQLSSQSNSHIHTWPLEKPWPWLDGPLLAK